MTNPKDQSAAETEVAPIEAAPVGGDPAAIVAAALDVVAGETPALPEGPVPEPPRPLIAGAFLKLEYEIKAVISRGLTNLYLADAGAYGETAPRLVAERALPPEAAAGQEPASDDDAAGQAGDAEPSGGAPVGPALSIEEQLAAMRAGATSWEASAADLDDAAFASGARLLPVCERFVQDGREYLLFDWVETVALQDHREPTHDERYLEMLGTLIDGLAELEASGRRVELTRDLLRVDEQGNLRFWGFVDAVPVAEDVAREAPSGALEQLREVNDFLLKHVFADSATMRLDDTFGGMTLGEEVKALATGIQSGEFADIDAAARALAGLYRPVTPLRVEAELLSDIGQERELNEDAGLVLRLQRAAHLGSYTFDLFAVADGMGGHEGGEVASDLTLRALQENLREHLGIDWNHNPTVRATLLKIVDHVNAEVVALSEGPQYRGTRAKPGATLVFAIRLGARLFVCNVGDSRAYKWSAGGGLARITRDHSYVQTLIDNGSITEEEAWDHPDGSIITAHIGYPKLAQRDVFLRLMAPGDKLLLVSDGVVDMLRDREIEPFLHQSGAAAICRSLVHAANMAGGLDNITVICVTFA